MSKLDNQFMVDKAGLLIGWLQVLNNGRIKPDDPSKKDRIGENSAVKNTCCNETGVVRDSKDFIEIIRDINKELSEMLL